MHVRGQQDEAQFIADGGQVIGQDAIGLQSDFGGQRGADDLVPSESFQSRSDHVADRANAAEPGALAVDLIVSQALIPGRQHDAVGAFAGHRGPDFLGREAANRGQPARQCLEDMPRRGLGRAPCRMVGRQRVEPVLDHVEVERAHVDRAEMVHTLVDLPVALVGVSVEHLILNRGGEIDGISIQRQHLLESDAVMRWIETGQIAEQEARGIADPAVGIGNALQDFIGNGHFLAVVGGRDPQPQHICAECVHDLLRRDHVAYRLRHFLAVGIDRETVGQYRFVRRLAMHRHRGQQRGLEPAAVLVGAFEVHRGRAAQFPALVEHAVVGYTGIEPDIENVRDRLVACTVYAQALGNTLFKPGIDAFGFDDACKPLEDCRTVGVGLLIFTIDEQTQRHAPGALARDAPVRAIFDHAANPCLAPVGNPAHLVDRGQRIAAQPGLVHGNEPLWRGTKRGCRLVTPAVRVAVFERFGRQQCAVGAHDLDDAVVGLPDELAGHFGGVRQENPATVDRVDHRQIIAQADLEVFLAVARGGVHGPGAGLGGHVFTQDHRYVVIVERMFQAQTLQ